MSNEIRDRVREQIISVVCPLADPLPTEEWCDLCVHWKNSVCCNPKADQILAIPELAIVDREVELPEWYVPESELGAKGLEDGERTYATGMFRGMDFLIQTGYVKEVK